MKSGATRCPPRIGYGPIDPQECHVKLTNSLILKIRYMPLLPICVATAAPFIYIFPGYDITLCLSLIGYGHRPFMM